MCALFEKYEEKFILVEFLVTGGDVMILIENLCISNCSDQQVNLLFVPIICCPVLLGIDYIDMVLNRSRDTR